METIEVEITQSLIVPEVAQGTFNVEIVQSFIIGEVDEN